MTSGKPWYEGTRPEGAAIYWPKHLVQPDSWVGHIPFARWILEALQPKTLVELGTHTGNSYFSFCQAIKECNLQTHAHAVDTWLGDKHAGYYGHEVYSEVQKINLEYSDFSQLHKTTFDQGVNLFANGSIDLLHIDGLHTYEAVKHDFENWLPKMTPQGVVIFHDINVHREDFGVHKLWQEITETGNTMAFQHSNGLGVLQLGDQESRVIPDLESEKAKMADYFAGLGRHMSRYLDSVEDPNSTSNLRKVLAENVLLIAQMQGALDNKDVNMLEVQTALQAMTTSTSWKLTKPLRQMGNLFSKK